MATATIVSPNKATCTRDKTQRYYRPELDALRFCAFLAVYVCHSIPNEVVASTFDSHSGWGLRLLAAIKDAGNFGVCLFFMLSAFLITELLRRERETYGQIHVGAFYLRRMLRIWPLYIGITVVYALAGYHVHAMRLESGRVFSYFFLVGNWYIALHPWIQTPLRSLWSISVEEQFYFVWPLLARLGGVSWLVRASFAIVPLSLLAIALASTDKAYAYNTVWLNSFTQFQFFAWGALFALTLNGLVPTIRCGVRVAIASAGAAIWLLAAFVTGIKRPGAHVSSIQFCSGYLLVAVGCLLFLIAASGTARLRVPRWAMYLGKISFGLYVFHETAFLLVDEAQKHLIQSLPSLALWTVQHTAIATACNKVLALGLTVALAMMSYRFWESPFLRLKQRITWIPSRGI